MISLTKTSFIVLLALLFFQFSGVYSTTFTITNHCTYTVWPAILSAHGTSPLPSTGFTLQHGHSNTLRVPPAWTGRLWGRTLCSLDTNANFSCATGDCGTSTIECTGGNAAPPVTLVEFYFNVTGGLKISLGLDFNLPVSLAHVCAYDKQGIFTCSSLHYSITFCPNIKSRMKAGNKKEGSGKKVVKYTGLYDVLTIISGFIIFRMRLRLSNRDWEIRLSTGIRADSTIPTNVTLFNVALCFLIGLHVMFRDLFSVVQFSSSSE